MHLHVGILFFRGAVIFSGHPIYRLLRSEMWSGLLKTVSWITWDMFGVDPTSLGHLMCFSRLRIQRDVAENHHFCCFSCFHESFPYKCLKNNKNDHFSVRSLLFLGLKNQIRWHRDVGSIRNMSQVIPKNIFSDPDHISDLSTRHIGWPEKIP